MNITTPNQSRLGCKVARWKALGMWSTGICRGYEWIYHSLSRRRFKHDTQNSGINNSERADRNIFETKIIYLDDETGTCLSEAIEPQSKTVTTIYDQILFFRSFRRVMDILVFICQDICYKKTCKPPCFGKYTLCGERKLKSLMISDESQFFFTARSEQGLAFVLFRLFGWADLRTLNLRSKYSILSEQRGKKLN